MNKQDPIENQKPQGWFSVSFFSAHLVFAITELNYLQRYRQQMSSYVEETIEDFRVQVNDYIRRHNLDAEQSDNYYELMQDEHHMYTSFFPSTLEYSILVSACTIVESRLAEICKELEKEPKTTIYQTWMGTKDKGIRRANSFLDRNFALKMSNHVSWPTIIDYYEIRNCIAHADGKIDEMKNPSPKDIREIIHKYHSTGLSESNLHTIVMSDNFIENAINEMKLFFTSLQEQFKVNKFVGPIVWP